MLIEDAYKLFTKVEIDASRKCGLSYEDILKIKDIQKATSLVDVNGIILDETNINSSKIHIDLPFQHLFIKNTEDSIFPFEMFMYIGESGKPNFYFGKVFNPKFNEYCRFILGFDETSETYSLQILDDIYSDAKPYGITKGTAQIIGNLYNNYIGHTLSKLNAISIKNTHLYKTCNIEIGFKDKKQKKRILYTKPIYIYCNENQDGLKVISRYSKTYGKLERLISWNVRGHWRKLDNPYKRGKNAQGKYVIEGYTWVKPCIKGNKDIAPQQKTYIAV